MSFILSQPVRPIIPNVDLPGLPERTRGFRFSVHGSDGRLLFTHTFGGVPSLAFIRRYVPIGGSGLLEQALYAVAGRRVYTRIAVFYVITEEEARARTAGMVHMVKAAAGINKPKVVQAAIDNLVKDLEKAIAKQSEQATLAALKALDQNAALLTAGQYQQVAQAMGTNYGKVIAGLENIPAVEVALSEHGLGVVSAARQATARDSGLSTVLGLAPNMTDKAQVGFMVEDQGFYIKDEYDNRPAKLAEKANGIIAPMFADGYGRDEIAAALYDQVGPWLKGQDLNYFTTVADNHITRARSWGNLSSMSDAGFEEFEISAVLDEATTDTCRFLHGQHISLPKAMATMAFANQQQGQMDKWSPFIQSKTSEGITTLTVPYSTPKGGGKFSTVNRVIATSADTGAGKWDTTGTWNAQMSPDEMADSRIGAPPYHHRCRSTILPVGSMMMEEPERPMVQVPQSYPVETVPVPAASAKKPPPIVSAPYKPPPVSSGTIAQTAGKIPIPAKASSPKVWDDYLSKRLSAEEGAFDAVRLKGEQGLKLDGKTKQPKWNPDEFRKLTHSFIQKSSAVKGAKSFAAAGVGENIPESLATAHQIAPFSTASMKRQVQEAIKDFRALVPSGAKDRTVFVNMDVSKTPQAGSHVGFKDTSFVQIKENTGAFTWKETVVHELTHAWEMDNAQLKTVRDKYMRKRLRRDIAAGNYKRYEFEGDVGYRFGDNFPVDYVGFTKDGKTFPEAITCGVQMMYKDPLKLYRTDTDFFMFTLSVMRGL